MGREILVVKRNVLFKEGEFNGFVNIRQRDFADLILNNFEYVDRTDELENDSSIQQIIPYVWLVNPVTKKVFLYKRSSGGGEGRLHNKYSGGVGGHIDKDTEEGSENPVIDAMMRELKEEVVMENYPLPKFVGYINDDSDSVGGVHFGVVAIAETEEDVKPDEHMTQGKFYSVDEVGEIFSSGENEVENWTRISWGFVRDYVNSL